ncbi:MAG: hypothetical protein ACE5EA_01280 [Nitrospirota bacterium]
MYLIEYLNKRKRGVMIFMAVLAMFFVLSPSVSLFAEEAKKVSVDYRDFPIIGSRNAIWIVAQLHLLFGSFILAVPIFALIAEFIGWKSGDKKFDGLAHEFANLLSAAYSMTLMLGGMLLFLFVSLYPKFWNYLTGIFWPTYLVYIGLFLLTAFSVYLYSYCWDLMEDKKVLHMFIGCLLNLSGFLIMCVSDSWMTYQNSPVVLPADIGAWERAWMAVNNFTWWPINIHRIIGNVAFGGFVCGAYAGIKFLGAKTDEERAHYDWMGYIGNFIGTFGLLPLPFAGYWLMREIYMFSQQMGITLMGGFLAWLFIIQAALIGALFLCVNYYFWQGLSNRIDGGETYKKFIIPMLVSLVACVGIWMTPHSIVATAEEVTAMGGAHHPKLGSFGVMSAKVTVVNIMILVTFISFLLYWRANQKETVRWATAGKIFQVILFTVAIVWVIVLGIWGYFVPAIVRINKFSVWQVLSVLTVMAICVPMTGMMLKNAKSTGEMHWGRMSVRSQYALIGNALLVVMLMTLMGYARSASRVHWHIFGVMRDTSRHAFSPALGFASMMWFLIIFIFGALLTFVFWIANVSKH